MFHADTLNMNIKNFLGFTPVSTPTPKASSIERPIKSSESSAEKDANGQQFYSKQKQKKEKMSNEQFEKAVLLLKEKSFMKDMNWLVEIFEDSGFRYAWVKDQSGATIRRIAEYDLWEMFDSTQQIPNKGQLLKKTA